MRQRVERRPQAARGMGKKKTTWPLRASYEAVDRMNRRKLYIIHFMYTPYVDDKLFVAADMFLLYTFVFLML